MPLDSQKATDSCKFYYSEIIVFSYIFTMASGFHKIIKLKKTKLVGNVYKANLFPVIT